MDNHQKAKSIYNSKGFHPNSNIPNYRSMRTSFWIFSYHLLETYCNIEALLWMLPFGIVFSSIRSSDLFCLYFVLRFLRCRNRILLWICRCLVLLTLVMIGLGRSHLRWSRCNEVLYAIKSLHLFFCVFLLIRLFMYFEGYLLPLDFWKMINSFIKFNLFILFFLLIQKYSFMYSMFYLLVLIQEAMS